MHLIAIGQRKPRHERSGSRTTKTRSAGTKVLCFCTWSQTGQTGEVWELWRESKTVLALGAARTTANP